MAKSSLVQEFKTFISRGNVIDLAVGIIVGSAFTGIVNSLVKDLIMPALGVVLGSINFSDYKIVVQPSVLDASGAVVTPEVAIAYGAFIQNIINFLIVAAAVFALVKAINAVQKKKEPETVNGPKETELSVLKDIRDSLKKK